MALTTEQQAQVDIQVAVQTAMEQLRHQNMLALEDRRAEGEGRRAKMELVRLAKEILIENARSKPVDARDVSAADITAFASALEAHINA